MAIILVLVCIVIFRVFVDLFIYFIFFSAFLVIFVFFSLVCFVLRGNRR